MIPFSATPASRAWQGKHIELTLFGKKSLNSAELEEVYGMEIESVEDPVSVADMLREVLKIAETQTDIPADLLEGLSFRFVTDSH